MEKFDVIVVGAGPAGSTVSTLLAREGLNVLMVERGQTAGNKNVSGGLLYSRLVAEVFPEFWKSAPVERAITAHQLVMLSADASVGMDFRSQHAAQPPYNAFSVLRAKFDPWMAKQAEEAGVTLITGVTVDELLLENGRVIGIQAGGDQLGADVVVVAEGTRALLLKQAGLRENFSPHDVSLGIKEVIALSEKTIEERFLCAPGTGMAYTLVGHTSGIEGGGFLYTNKASLSLGVVIKIDSLYKSKLQPHQVLDEFKQHPLVSRLIEGGEVLEYSAQTVHRGGFHLMSKLYGDGYMVAGSAARLLLNNVLTLRGMDFAVASGVAAAHAILEARQKGDYSSASLSGYEAHIKQTSIYEDWKTFKDTYPIMENERLFELYPELACEIVEGLFSASTTPSKKALALALKAGKGKVSALTLLKDMIQMGRGMAL
jgi:electron transfer flavoprotein-quinone oxidoreductase